MNPVGRLDALVRGVIAEWQELSFGQLQFWHRGEARLIAVALVGVAVCPAAGAVHGVALAHSRAASCCPRS